jgi:hypothetical protein
MITKVVGIFFLKMLVWRLFHVWRGIEREAVVVVAAVRLGGEGCRSKSYNR